jgi:hypothetical protein
MAARRWRRTTAGLLLALALSAPPGGGAAWQTGSESSPPPRPDAQSPLAQAIARHRAGILTLPGVVGVGPGDCAGAPCVVVFVEADTPELRRRIPPRLEGYPVQLTVSGGVPALGADDGPGATRPDLSPSPHRAGPPGPALWALALLLGGAVALWARGRRPGRG